MIRRTNLSTTTTRILLARLKRLTTATRRTGACIGEGFSNIFTN